MFLNTGFERTHLPIWVVKISWNMVYKHNYSSLNSIIALKYIITFLCNVQFILFISRYLTKNYIIYTFRVRWIIKMLPLSKSPILPTLMGLGLVHIILFNCILWSTVSENYTI